jgi:hypothetical protein
MLAQVVFKYTANSEFETSYLSELATILLTRRVIGGRITYPASRDNQTPTVPPFSIFSVMIPEDISISSSNWITKHWVSTAGADSNDYDLLLSIHVS